MVKRVFLAVSGAATLLMICLAGVIFTLLRNPPAATPTLASRAVFPSITPPATVTATPTLLPSITATPTQTEEQPVFTGPAIPRFGSGETVTIYAIHMVSEIEGWAIGGPGVDEHILFTSDSGKSWRDATPPEPASPGAPGKRAFAFFLDAVHAWATYFPTDFPASPPLRVWSSMDAGLTWQPAILPGSFDMDGGSAFDQLFFNDSQTGWLGLSHGAAAGSNPFSLLSTTDGGRNWQLLLAPFSPGSGSLDACCRNGLIFLDNQTGMVTAGGGAYPNAYVNWTRDGGVTWQSQDLTNNAADQVDAPFCQASSPQALSPLSAAVVVDCTSTAPDQFTQHSARLNLTTDRGQSWMSFPLPDPSTEASQWAYWQRSWRIQFPGDLAGFVFVEDSYQSADGSTQKEVTTLYQSQDGGQTWSFMGQTNWKGQFSFVNGKSGWAVARAGSEIALVRTSNGGRSWEILKTVVIQ